MRVTVFVKDGQNPGEVYPETHDDVTSFGEIGYAGTLAVEENGKLTKMYAAGVWTGVLVDAPEKVAVVDAMRARLTDDVLVAQIVSRVSSSGDNELTRAIVRGLLSEVSEDLSDILHDR